ncbi:hypothetical protein [Holospora obtusa]|nr:hypothetical protein [Holospora obtusa]
MHRVMSMKILVVFHFTQGQDHIWKGKDALVNRLMKADAVLSNKAVRCL